MKKTIRYIFRFLGWLFAGIIVLLVLVSLLIQTKPVKQKLSKIAETQAAKAINGELQIGKIEGNFFTGIALRNILWTYQNDTTAFVKSLEVSYELIPFLKGNALAVEGQLSEPYFFLKQSNDSTWNIQNLIKENNEDSPNKDKETGSFSFSLSDFEMTGGSIRVQALDSIIPKQVQNLNTRLSFDYAPNELRLNLKQFSFETLQPAFRTEKLAFILTKNQEEIELQNLYLQTSQNKLEGRADYSANPNLDISAQIESAPIHLNEFQFLIPTLKLPAHPTVKIDVKTENKGLQVALLLSDNNQSITLNIWSENFNDFIANKENTNLKYELEGNLQKIDLAYWLGNPQLNYLINGKLKLKGTGTNPETAKLVFDADLRESVLKERPIDKLKLAFNLQNGNLLGEVNGTGNFGTIRLNPDIKNLNKNPSYNLEVYTQNLNLAPLLGNDSLPSDINLQAKIKGESFDPETLTANANIILSESELKGILVDTLFANFSYNKKNFDIDSLWLKTQLTKVSASGNYNIDGVSDISLKSTFNGISEFSSFIPLENFQTKGNLVANLNGHKNLLNIEALLSLKQTRLDSLNVDSIVVRGNGLLSAKDTMFNASVYAGNFKSGNFELDSIGATLAYLSNAVSFTGEVSGKDISSKIDAQIALGKTQRIQLSDWEIKYQNQQFKLQQAAVLEIDSTDYRLSNFIMASGASDTAQFIEAVGTISRKGTQNFNLELANLDINKALKTVDNNLEVSGLLNARIRVKGNAANPEINGGFEVENALFNGYEFTDLGSDFTMKNKKLDVEGKIIPQDSGRIEISGTIPLEANFDSIQFSIKPEDPLKAAVLIDSFPLAILQAINIQEQITGVINGNVEVAGTLKEPDPSGNLNLKNASFKMPEYGIDYRDITLNVDFLNDAVRLDSFSITSADGAVQASGTVDFSSAFYKGDVRQSELEINFNTFNPFNHKQFNMQLSGNASLKGEKGAVVFDGDLTVPEAELYLPAILNVTGKLSTPKLPEPILMREIEKLKEIKDTIQINTTDTTQIKGFEFTYLDKFTGELNLEIPKNTWIKNDDMYIEIAGDVQLIKNNDYFELFGSVNVVRGQYELLGKTFVVDEGTISFQGGEEIMPGINITASYAFRNSERVSQELSISVSGTANEPEIEFMLDGNTINEGDALSYIFFGQSLDELSLDQQENVSGTDDLASAAVTSLLSSQLSNYLGKNIDIDYLDIKSDGFDNATVVVGKYITNDLFVSYEQRFGETDETEIEKYEVKLEYELFKFLFFQLNNSSNESGFNLIFKNKF